VKPKKKHLFSFILNVYS